jgi:hypothetical protein
LQLPGARLADHLQLTFALGNLVLGGQTVNYQENRTLFVTEKVSQRGLSALSITFA